MAARSTFRDPAGDVAWQRQLRDRYAAEGVPAGVPHLDVSRAVVRPVSRRLAAQVILRYEWLGTMVSSSYHFGLFFGPFCAGVTCIASATAGLRVHAEFGLERDQVLTLVRGACVHWAPPGSNSRLVAWTARLLRATSSARVMIAYADTDAGEIGTIYQAAGWVYIGRGQSKQHYIAPNGRIYDHKIIDATRRRHGHIGRLAWRETRIAMQAAGWGVQASNRKHKYVCLLDRSDRALVDRVERMRQPYPKRAKHPGDALVVQTGEGGSTPTGTLQEIV